MLIKNPSASKQAVEKFLERIKIELPTSYLNFLLQSNGAFVESKKLNISFQISEIQQVLNENDLTEIKTFLPNFFIFGNDGANELLTFKLDEPHKWAVFMTPLIVMSEEDSQLLCPNFETFLEDYA